MKFSLFLYLLISCLLTFPLALPQPGWINSALESIGHLTGDAVVKILPNAATDSVVRGTANVAFDNPNLAKSALEAMAKGAAEAALKDQKGSFAIAQAAGRGSWIVISNAAKMKLAQLSRQISAISKHISNLALSIISKIPGLGKLAPGTGIKVVSTSVTEKESHNLIEAGLRALAAGFDKISESVAGLNTKLAELQIQAIEEGAKVTMHVGQTETGKLVITELSEAVAGRLLAESSDAKTLALAEEAGKIMTEKALKRPGVALSLAGSAISGAQPLVAAYLMKSLHEFMDHVESMIKAVPSEALHEVKTLGNQMKAKMENALALLLKKAPDDIVYTPKLGVARFAHEMVSSVTPVTEPELMAETEKMAFMLKDSLASFEEIGNSLLQIHESGSKYAYPNAQS